MVWKDRLEKSDPWGRVENAGALDHKESRGFKVILGLPVTPEIPGLLVWQERLVIRERQVIRGLPVIPDPRDQLVIQETPEIPALQETPEILALQAT